MYRFGHNISSPNFAFSFPLTSRRKVFVQAPKWAWSGSHDQICNYPRDAMLARVFATATCPAVCLSVTRRGGATGGCEGYDVPPTFAVCTPQGVQCYLRCTPAGYCRLHLAAKVTQLTFRFSTRKFCFLYSLLQQWHWKFHIQSSILNFALLENRKSMKVKICYLFISTCHRNMTYAHVGTSL